MRASASPGPTTTVSEPLRLYALTGIPLIEPGDDIAAPILAAAERVAGGVQEGDLLVVAQKIVSKSDFATYAYALKALIDARAPLHGTVELHFTYDEEIGGAVGPGWLLSNGIVKPDYLIAAWFTYSVVVAHNGDDQLSHL